MIHGLTARRCPSQILSYVSSIFGLGQYKLICTIVFAPFLDVELFKNSFSLQNNAKTLHNPFINTTLYSTYNYNYTLPLVSI